jgi:hypothetical protein
MIQQQATDSINKGVVETNFDGATYVPAVHISKTRLSLESLRGH